jgi:hypothetical protein
MRRQLLMQSQPACPASTAIIQIARLVAEKFAAKAG